MAIHYPNGGLFTTKNSAVKKSRANNTIYGKRGMSLEDEIKRKQQILSFQLGSRSFTKSRHRSRSLMFIIPNVAPQ